MESKKEVLLKTKMMLMMMLFEGGDRVDGRWRWTLMWAHRRGGVRGRLLKVVEVAMVREGESEIEERER